MAKVATCGVWEQRVRKSGEIQSFAKLVAAAAAAAAAVPAHPTRPHNNCETNCWGARGAERSELGMN